MANVSLLSEVQVYKSIVISSSYDRLVHDQYYIISRGNNPTSLVLTLAHAKSRLTRSMSLLTCANKYIETQQQAVYCLYDEQDGSSRPDYGYGNSKELYIFKHQVSALSKKSDDALMTGEPSGDEDDEKNNRAKFSGKKLNPALGFQ